MNRHEQCTFYQISKAAVNEAINLFQFEFHLFPYIYFIIIFLLCIFLCVCNSLQKAESEIIVWLLIMLMGFPSDIFLKITAWEKLFLCRARRLFADTQSMPLMFYNFDNKIHETFVRYKRCLQFARNFSLKLLQRILQILWGVKVSRYVCAYHYICWTMARSNDSIWGSCSCSAVVYWRIVAPVGVHD